MEAPEALSKLNPIELENVSEFMAGISRDIDYHKQQRSDWENRLDIWYAKRYGIRPRKVFPWLDAANFVLPLIDIDINRQKPAYINLAFAVSPVVVYEPYGAEDIEPARKRERLFDWRLKTKMRFFEPYSVGVDKMLEKGFVIFKIMWRYETTTYTEVIDVEELDPQAQQVIFNADITDEELGYLIMQNFKPDMTIKENEDAIFDAVKKLREGKTRVEIEFYEKSHDEPEVIACDPKDDIVVPIDTKDINDAQFIDYKFWKTANQIKISMRDDVYNKYEDSDINSWGNKKTPQSQLNSWRDGTSNYFNSDLILLHETCVWYDIDGDGIEERCIVTWPDSDPTKILRFIELPYSHGMWPYVQVKREMIDSWFYSSRGIPALDDDFQTGISTKFNQNIDTGTIVNTPTVVHKRNAVFNKNNLRYVPGQDVEVGDMADYEVRHAPNLAQQNFYNDMQYLKAWSNERMPSLNSTLSSPNTLPGSGQQGQKTAREVSSIEAGVSQVQSLDLLIFQMQMSNVYYQIDALWEQFGPEEEEILITGEQPVKMSRYEIQGKFNIVPFGKIENSNPAVRAARSFQLYRMFLNDPDVKQDELKRMYLNDFDPRIASRLLYTQQEKQMMQMMAEQQQEKAVQQGTALKRLQNMLELEKSAAEATIQGRKFAPE